ncbi:class I SAM-dependent methyltransferase [Microbacterium hibisci]|uniref:class I SAM-dependent methyltransferase n=1 Tax=Microbacterium hibisci TaxID=2036000 RepID=UPI001943FE41|nr:class I SAM-dependent methyltransferase [Microbacterium hibisci]
MVDPLHFERRADEYAAARPPYPPELWERMRALGALEPGIAALDLGAGSGQATGPLLAAGVRVTAVEPGERLAGLLRHAYPSVEVLTARAEDVELPTGAFDLVTAATSIHWMDLAVVVPKVHAALAPGGRFAVWRNVFGDPDAPVTSFRRRVAEIVGDRTAPPRPGPSAEDRDATAAALTAAGLFVVEDATSYRWRIALDAPAVGRLFSTFSDWSEPEVARAVDAVVDLGGSTIEHYSSWLLVLRPVRAAS